MKERKNIYNNRDKEKKGGGGRAYKFESLQTSIYFFYDARSRNEESKK